MIYAVKVGCKKISCFLRSFYSPVIPLILFALSFSGVAADFSSLVAITSKNAAQVTQLTRLGKGTVSQAAVGSYAVVVSEKTYSDKEWREVADTLVKKYNGRLIKYATNVEEVLPALREMMPNYTCFIARPVEEANGRFVRTVHQLTRRLDSDPYTDTVWGILTGYEAADALRIAKHVKPLMIRRVLSGVAIDINAFEEGVCFSEKEPGVQWHKEPGGKMEKTIGSVDSTKLIVNYLNYKKPDCVLTSGHSSQHDWQIGYRYRNGQFRSAGGQLFAIDTKGHRFNISSPNPKIYLPLGNCLMGDISDRDCMVLAWIHTGGAYQMVGYIVPTWFGYGGWGVLTYLTTQPGRFTVAEAFYFNHQSLLCQLVTEQGNQRGLKYDRDVVAFYGDPAWQARLAPHDLPWTQTWSVKGSIYTFTIETREDGTWPNRPIASFLPHRVQNVKVLKGAEFKPVITDNFILVPLAGKFQKGTQIKVVFQAQPIGP